VRANGAILQAADQTVKAHCTGKAVRHRGAEIKRELFWNDGLSPIG
jgi:hypothetical protein